VTLRFLLDEQVHPATVRALEAASPGIEVQHIYDWHAGELAGADDAEVLEQAFLEGLTLVTFDLRTMPRHLARRIEQGESHAGAVLVDDKTIRQNDPGGLARALAKLWRDRGQEEWLNTICFLKRPS